MFILYGKMPALYYARKEIEEGKSMKLTELKADTFGVVRSLGRDAHFLSRITSIGLTEGAEFQVVRNDKKMPVLVYVRETLLALNRNDCEKIEVEVRS